MKIENATAPRYSRADKSAIDVQVKFAEFAEVLPFTATAADVEPWGVELFNRAKAGDFGPVAAYVGP